MPEKDFYETTDETQPQSHTPRVAPPLTNGAVPTQNNTTSPVTTSEAVESTNETSQEHNYVSNKRASRVSVKSKISYRDSEGNLFFEERKSSAGRKTVAELVQNDPDKRVRRKRGVIAPHDVEDNKRSLSDLQYEKYEKDDK